MKLFFTSVLVCLLISTSFAQIETCPAGVDPNAIPKFSGVPTLQSGMLYSKVRFTGTTM